MEDCATQSFTVIYSLLAIENIVQVSLINKYMVTAACHKATKFYICGQIAYYTSPYETSIKIITLLHFITL